MSTEVPATAGRQSLKVLTVVLKLAWKSPAISTLLPLPL